ncbi:hypothetical protein JXI42_04315 [bacterium]|nr:hypothetical protein [bacterium]
MSSGVLSLIGGFTRNKILRDNIVYHQLNLWKLLSVPEVTIIISLCMTNQGISYEGNEQ